MEKKMTGTDNDRTDGARVCARTGRRRRGAHLFCLLGALSFGWFLIRVVPKPSRAAYPCQRAAAPLAAGFLAWIVGLAGTALGYRKWRSAAAHRRTIAASLAAAAALAAGFVTAANLPRRAGAAYPAWHEPIGVARGIHPGRVVWVWNPGATDWAGYSSSDRWYDDTHTDPQVVERMLSQAVRALAGKQTDAEAWDAIFRYSNRKRGRGDRGYLPGEKIMIKLNMVTCNIQINNVNLSTWNKIDKNRIDVAPQMVRALLKHLVYTVGVSQSNITVGDPTAYWPNQYLDQIRAEYPNVKYLQYSSGPNRTGATFSTTPFFWSTSAADGKLQDYLPTSYVQADYYINFTTLKGHSAGITLCGKNDYGSLIRLPNGWRPETGTQNYYNLHYSLPNAIYVPGTGHYRAIVDLMGHPQLGGKAILYLIDGLYGGYYSEGVPYKWNSAPFNGDWPSSLFVSQDPVAIDSVGYDFINAEWPNIVSGGTGAPGSLQGGAEDYLHEAALADSPPSGTFYDPDRDGIAMSSLGVHEHWVSPTTKKYSRNLGLAEGIELVSMTYDPGAIQRAKLSGDGVGVVVVGAVITAAFADYFYIESDDRTFGVRVNKTAHGLSVGTRVNVSGTMTTTSDFERCIVAAKVTPAGSGTIKPVHLNAKSLGGADWNYNPSTGAGQRGVTGGHGLNNIGLLVSLSGKVVEADGSASPAYYRLADGSGIPVRVILPPGCGVPQVGTYVTAVGVSSCEDQSGQAARLLRASAGWQLRQQ